MHKLLQDYIMATDAQFSSCIATNASAKRRNSETENDPEAPRLNAKKRSANCPPARSLARLFCNEKASSIVSYNKERAQDPLAPTFGHSYERVGKRQVAGKNLSHLRLSGNVGRQMD
jgi:hypothetical protein